MTPRTSSGSSAGLGANVLIPEYVGYGMSGGTPNESGCRETAETAVPPTSSLARMWTGVGSSLPGGDWAAQVALDLTSRHPVAGVATFSTFTRMSDVSRLLLPFLPASLLLRHRFENVAKMAKIGCPVLIGHGRRDKTIPFAMADLLAEAARGPIERVTIEEADHNDFF